MSNKTKNKRIKELSGAAVSEAELKKIEKTMREDPYMSRNEFKPGFYDQKDKPATTVETIKGTGATAPKITDTESFMEGGFARGQKAIQVKKVPFRGVF
jgi:hypothetical protein